MDQLTSIGSGLLQVLRDYNSVLVPVAGLLGLILILRSLSGREGAGAGLIGRMGGVIASAFTTNWQLTLLGTCALVLSLASGWRTWDGMSNFTGEPLVSFLITFGLQGVLLIISWLIGESFASGLSQRTSEAKVKAAGERVVGMIVGALFAVGAAVLVANAFGVLDLRHAASSGTSWSSLADKMLYVAVGLLLVATLVINNKSDVVQPYLQSMRVMAKSAVLWVMLLACIATSVFFSFDSFFSSIFPQSERVRAAELRAQNQVAGIVSDIGATISERHMVEAERLFSEEAWKKGYEPTLERLARESQGAEAAIEGYFVQQMEIRERAKKEQHERMASANSGQAGLLAKKASLTDELSRLKAERPNLAGEYAEKKTELDNRARGIDGKRVEAMAEDKGAEGTLKAGKGPVFRQRMGELAQMQEAYKIQEDRVRDAQKRLNAADARVSQVQRELAAVDGEIGKLQGEVATAEQRMKMMDEGRTAEDGPRVDPARVRLAFERARNDFRQEPTVERLNSLTQQCTQLYNALAATPATKDRVRGIDCDPKQANEAAARVFALNAGIKAFEANCAGGDKLMQHKSTDELYGFARRCLADSGLPSKETEQLRTKINFIDLSRDDKAHRFVVTWNAFQDGNRLAYLALAIAIALDSLIFMSGLFGANAVRSPLTDLEGRSDLSADQLEAAIDAALKSTPDPRATLAALVRSMHPVAAGDGFTSEAVLDERESLCDDMRSVLVAGATIGAVRRVGSDRDRFYVRTGLARYFAIAQAKTWVVRGKEASRKELVNVIGVALLPDPQSAAHVVLSELHPISDLAGYSAEVDLARLNDKGHRPLLLGVLGAGATVEGAVLRDKSVSSRYFVSIDTYKTLLMLRAAAVPAFRIARAVSGREHASYGGALNHAVPFVAGPAAQTALPPPSAPRQTGADRSSDRREATQGSDQSDAELRGYCRDRLLGALNIDADVAARRLATSGVQAAALEAWNLLSALSAHNKRLAELLEDHKNEQSRLIAEEYTELRSKNGGHQARQDVIDAVEGQVHDLLPAYMLFPENGLLRYLITSLESAAQPDNGISDAEQGLKDLLKDLEADFQRLDLADAGSWHQIGERLRSGQRSGRVFPFRPNGGLASRG